MSDDQAEGCMILFCVAVALVVVAAVVYFLWAAAQAMLRFAAS